MGNALALNTAIFGKDVPTADKLRAIKAAGFDTVELWRRDCEDGTTLGAVADLLIEIQLGIATYGPLMDFDGMPPGMREAKCTEALAMISEARDLRATTLHMPFSTHLETDATRTVKDIRWLCRRAAEQGLLVAAEALAWSTSINSVAAAWDIIQDVGADNLGLAVDALHLSVRGEGPGVLSRVAPGRIVLVQLSDLRHKASREQVIDVARHHRQLPGDGYFPTGDLLACLAGRGYTGPISVEVFSDTYAAMDPYDAARKAMASLSRCGLPIYS